VLRAFDILHGLLLFHSLAASLYSFTLVCGLQAKRCSGLTEERELLPPVLCRFIYPILNVRLKISRYLYDFLSFSQWKLGFFCVFPLFFPPHKERTRIMYTGEYQNWRWIRCFSNRSTVFLTGSSAFFVLYIVINLTYSKFNLTYRTTVSKVWFSSNVNSYVPRQKSIPSENYGLVNDLLDIHTFPWFSHVVTTFDVISTIKTHVVYWRI
jgi:hypothetical protein